MYAAMEHFEPNVFLKDNEEGIERVKKDNGAFAYFMESSTINYITQKECDLMAVGPKLDEKSYGIGMPLSMIQFCISMLTSNIRSIVVLIMVNTGCSLLIISRLAIP